MKNLKKVLALALALVMLLGMFSVVSAAEADEKLVASDFIDWPTVSQKDSVALAVDLKIINGIPAGDDVKYDPAGNIDRASWAKMVYSAIMGTPDASEFEDPSFAVFSDVVSDHWALGHIAYLNSMGYIVGDGTGKYNPTGKVTVVEAYKTMLVALGYNANREGYANNDNWKWNISRGASNNKLNAGITQKNDEALTRDNAARLIFNTLNAQMVDTEISYQDGKEVYGAVTKYWDDDDKTDPLTLGENIYGLTPVTAQVTDIDAKGNAVLTGDDVDAEWALPASADQLGMNVTVYTDGKGNLISGMLCTGSTTVKKVAYDWDATAYGKATTVAEDGKKDKTFVAEVDEGAMYILNGAASTKAAAKAAIVSGNKVELLIANGGEKIDVVKVTEYKAYKAAAPKTRTTNKGVDQVQITGVNSAAWTDAANVTGADAVAKDDIILVANVGSEWIVEKAESITGAVSGFSATTVTVKGQTLADAASAVSGSAAKVAGWSKDNTGDYTFYLDKAGDVIYVVAPEEAASDTSEKLALLSATGYVSGGTSLEAGDGYWQASIINLDGSKETLNNVIGTGWDEDDKVVEPEAAKDWAGVITAPVLPLVRVTTTKDGVVIETVTVTSANYIGDKNNLVEVSANINYIEGDTATKATNFIIWNTTTKAYEFKTGYSSLASFNAYGYKAVVDDATYVYLITDGKLRGTTSEAAEYIWLTSLEWTYSDGAYVYEIVNDEGQEATIKCADELSEVEVGFAMITAVDENGKVTTVVNVDAPTKTGVACEDGVFTIEGVPFEYDDATVCLVIDVDAEGELVEMGSFNPDTIDLTVAEGEEGTFQAVTAVAYGSDGKDVASGAKADLIIVWRVALAEEAEEA